MHKNWRIPHFSHLVANVWLSTFVLRFGKQRCLSLNCVHYFLVRSLDGAGEKPSNC